MAYCAVPDLLVGDLPISIQSGEQFINAASDEIDMKLAGEFTWPHSPLSVQAQLILKRMNVLIGTGRLIMAQAVGSEDTGTHAYGTYLLREGQMLLAAVIGGDVVLDDVPKHPTTTTGNAPSIVYEDSQSAVDVFYGFAMRGETNTWQPGV